MARLSSRRLGPENFASAIRSPMLALIGAPLSVAPVPAMDRNNSSVTGDYSRGASGFWIENGKRSYPVSEVTIAGNLIDLFKALSPANDLEFRFGTNAPTVRVEGLTVGGL